ncbi:MAG: hypothetical protein K2X41_01655 [Hyphomicrobium sp.]|nr:hypothetical protein [Hyphomicrobium sp.]
MPIIANPAGQRRKIFTGRCRLTVGLFVLEELACTANVLIQAAFYVRWKRVTAMRVTSLVKASNASRASQTPSIERPMFMGNFNEAHGKNGVMLGGEGVQPTSKGAQYCAAKSRHFITLARTVGSGSISSFHGDSCNP